ncbi:digestive cysteine proteinase 1-like [Oscarella lobularis]|uniref:digestive cysteine proteinase 1-like n=1 Tax=Oscarella lobularis TaxID=121494 RepID=UPI003313D137
MLRLFSTFVIILYASSLVCSASLWADSVTYEASGLIQMPYSEVTEPFHAWYDGKNQRSRQDYYNGLNNFYQRADIKPYGVTYSIVPVSTNTGVANAMTCFGMNGTSDFPLTSTQGVLPDTTNFTHASNSTYSGTPCQVYFMQETIGSKINRYTLFVTEPMANGAVYPLYFEFIGYDNLFGSHYDKYTITYEEFKMVSDLPVEIFEVPSEMKCSMIGSQSNGVMNPIRSLLKDTKEIDEEFEAFKTKHSKVYSGTAEHEQRKANFRHNYRFVHSMNRQYLTYSLAINHLADLSDSEQKMMRGRRHTGPNNGQAFEMTEAMIADLPPSMDWRLYGAVTPVKDQGICGSCWSFGSAETIEGALFLSRNRTGLTELSQQNLMDCTWAYGNAACDGGEETQAYEWIMKNGGIATAYSYGPYLMADGKCHFENAEIGARIASYVNVTSKDETALKVAIAMHGPIAVGIDASHRSFSFYANGVYFEPQCGNTLDDLDHSVLAVGYGNIYGQDYWLIKNSWSTYWGDDGYTLMAMKENNCGVETSATYVNILKEK